MDSKLLTESGWKATALKFKIKDNGLQQTLAAYEKLDDHEHAARLKALASVNLQAGNLKKVKEVAALPQVNKYLTDLLSAAESDRKQIEAAAAAKASAEAKKREAEEKQGDEEEEEEDNGDYPVRLIAAFQKLKSGKDLAFEFIVCDAKPHCALMVAKRINPKHKEQLSKITGGSKRFLHVGRCHFEDGRFHFTMEQPVSGLARKLQDSIKNFTSKKLPIKVGAESADADDEQPASGQSSAAAAAKPEPPALANASDVWHKTWDAIEATIEQLKTAAKAEFANEEPAVVTEVEQMTSRFDGVLAKLDHSLADSLAKAHAAKDSAARNAELKIAKGILTDFILHVKSDPLIAHIDANPFGVKTNLKQNLSDCLKHMAEAIGRGGSTA